MGIRGRKWWYWVAIEIENDSSRLLIVIFGNFPIGWPNRPGIAGKRYPKPSQEEALDRGRQWSIYTLTRPSRQEARMVAS